MSGAGPSTPVFVLTGFLGSGKTSLLRHLLADPSLADTAVLINEFGEIALDHHLVDRVDGTTVLLKSGCLCCTVRGEVVDAVKALLGRRDRGEVGPFRRIVIETTGLADPLPVMSTLSADPVIRHHVHLAAVVTTVDAVNGAEQLDRHPESVAQAAAADRLVLTKTDLCDAATADRVVTLLRRLNPDAPLLRSFPAPPRAEDLLVQRPALAGVAGLRCVAVSGDTGHADTVSSLSVSLEGPLDWTLFGLWLTMLLHRHGHAILRVKGLLQVAGSDTPVAIHGVGPLVHVPTHLSAWPGDDRRSLLVFVARGLDVTAIEQSMAAFGLLGEGAGPRPSDTLVASSVSRPT